MDNDRAAGSVVRGFSFNEWVEVARVLDEYGIASADELRVVLDSDVLFERFNSTMSRVNLLESRLARVRELIDALVQDVGR